MTPQEFVKLFRKHGGVRAVARAVDQPLTNINLVYRKAVHAGLMEYIPMGRKTRMAEKHIITKQRIKAMKAEKLTPKKGAIKRYIVTSAQNNTRIHEPVWNNLVALAKYYDAQLMVSTYLYYRRSPQANMSKNDKGHTNKDVWYDERIEPYRFDKRAELAKGLVFCGELNIIPTAARPLSGLEVYTGRHSMIVPHAKLALESIATVGGRGTKFNYTTGTVTLRNYIQRKEGFKGEFHHSYGGLLVEVDEDGHWWVRQLNADSAGTIYDLDLCVYDGKVTSGHRVEAITFGDVHVEEIDTTIEEATWGEGGVVDILKPKYQFLHDVNSFFARSLHVAKDTFKMFRRYVNETESVAGEVDQVADFLRRAMRKDSQLVIVDSNHHRFVTRWLNEIDARRDPINARYWSELLAKVYGYIEKHGKEPNMLELMLEGYDGFEATFVDGNTSFVICKDNGGGIECSLHGDRGPNGARGNLRSFAKMGRRTNTGHSHVAGIVDGGWSGGTKSKLRLEYNDGPSSWSHSDIVTYPNGKRAILTYYAGKAWA